MLNIPTKDIPKDGILEGVARGLSQASVYILEFNKTQLQYYGKIPKYSALEWTQHLSRGLLSSTISSGVVYGSYFSVYNQFPNKAVAGMVATITTSIIKIPIANSMRVLQTSNHPHMFSAGKSIYKAQGLKGIYSGYGLSLIDDYLDMEIRIHLYNFLRNLVSEKEMNPQVGLILGSITGSIAAAVTTPFDTLRCHMAIMSTQKTKTNMFIIMKQMLKSGGFPIFIRGIGYRASSNALRTALFCGFYELLLHQNRIRTKQK